MKKKPHNTHYKVGDLVKYKNAGYRQHTIVKLGKIHYAKFNSESSRRRHGNYKSLDDNKGGRLFSIKYDVQGRDGTIFENVNHWELS